MGQSGFKKQMAQHERWMNEAIALAVENVRSGRGGPFGAVVTRNDELIATGTNLVTATNDPTAHAEIVAIRASCRALSTFQLAGCEIYSSCEPCPMCAAAIYWARPAGYYFASTRGDAAAAGFDDAFIDTQLGLPTDDRSIRTHHVLTANRLAPFVEWARSTSKIQY